jgi:hypothetical protein
LRRVVDDEIGLSLEAVAAKVVGDSDALVITANAGDEDVVRARGRQGGRQRLQ